MNRFSAALALALLAASGAEAAAQADAPAGFEDEFLAQFDASMSKLIDLAEAMPADRYAWSPGNGVMPVARVYAHVSRYNYLYPVRMMGVELPAGIDLERMEETREKDAVIELLRESREFVRRGVRGMPREQLAAETRLYGRDVQQWAVLFQLLAHMNEHLGQSIAYARMNGVVPPWSR